MSNIYYVYVHKHPTTNEIVYVGMGSKGRAWSIYNSGGENAAYGHRNMHHYNWFVALESEGYTLGDIVEIKAKMLTKREALDIERDLIDDYRPPFNKFAGLKMLKVTKDKYLAAIAMREEGLSYSAIGLDLGFSTMTVYRALNGLTKNIGDDYGR